jgi:hypothetical protein
MAYSQTVTGARARIEITSPGSADVTDGSVLFASGVSYTENHEHVPIFVLDRLAAMEYAPTAYVGSISCQSFRIPGESSKKKGFQQRLEKILQANELQFTIYDRNGDSPLLTARRVRFLGRSGGVTARGEWTESWEFAVILMDDESGTSAEA